MGKIERAGVAGILAAGGPRVVVAEVSSGALVELGKADVDADGCVSVTAL